MFAGVTLRCTAAKTFHAQNVFHSFIIYICQCVKRNSSWGKYFIDLQKNCAMKELFLEKDISEFYCIKVMILYMLGLSSSFSTQRLSVN